MSKAKRKTREDQVITEITTVGGLRDAMKGLPAKQPLWAQIVPEVGGCWSVRMDFCNFIPNANPNQSVLTMHHPDLHSCINMDDNKDALIKYLEGQLRNIKAGQNGEN